MAAKTLLLNVSGMTCGKCEKIIREGIMEDVKEVKNVEVDRPESKVTVEFQTEIAEQFDEKKEQILSIVNSLVNGKFTATVVDSVKIVPNNEFTLWKEFDELQDSEDTQDKSDLQVCYLSIEGMTCDSCIYTIDSKISKKPGIRNISVDLKTEICAVIYDPNVTAPDFIIDYVHDLNEGFTATNKSNGQVFILHVQGLNCGKCVAKIESSFENSQVKVNLVHGKAYCFGGLDLETTRKTISDLGFKTYPYLPHQGRVRLDVEQIPNKDAVEADLASLKAIHMVFANAKKESH